MSIDSDDLNDLAGEYVLGTLAGADRIAFEGRLHKHTTFPNMGVAQPQDALLYAIVW